MSKRSFAEFSTGAQTDISHILSHADELLRAAQALKSDLEAFHTGSEPEHDVHLVLKRHSQSIKTSTQKLGLVQDEVAIKQETPSPKSRKIEKGQDAVPTLPTTLAVPHPTSLTRWTPQDIPPHGLPPLPPVLDPLLEQAALTHSGMVAKPTEMSYERLEWIGDAYLYLISSAFIFQTFPNLATGRSAQLREKLVKNETLSSYTLQYRLNERTRFPAEFDLHGRVGGSQASQKAKKKVLGDVLEAYVAAAILGDPDGLSRVVTWLKALWSTTITREIRDEHKSHTTKAMQCVENGISNGNNNTTSNAAVTDQDLNPKVVLAKTIVSKGVKISYEDLGEPKKAKDSGLPLYTVGVFLDGWGETHLQLGYGSGLSKKQAGAKAAQKALDNKKLIKKFEIKKLDFQAALERQNGQEGPSTTQVPK